jgi:hypothetical protein
VHRISLRISRVAKGDTRTESRAPKAQVQGEARLCAALLPFSRTESLFASLVSPKATQAKANSRYLSLTEKCRNSPMNGKGCLRRDIYSRYPAFTLKGAQLIQIIFIMCTKLFILFLIQTLYLCVRFRRGTRGTLSSPSVLHLCSPSCAPKVQAGLSAKRRASLGCRRRRQPQLCISAPKALALRLRR